MSNTSPLFYYYTPQCPNGFNESLPSWKEITRYQIYHNSAPRLTASSLFHYFTPSSPDKYTLMKNRTSESMPYGSEVCNCPNYFTPYIVLHCITFLRYNFQYRDCVAINAFQHTPDVALPSVGYGTNQHPAPKMMTSVSKSLKERMVIIDWRSQIQASQKTQAKRFILFPHNSDRVQMSHP